MAKLIPTKLYLYTFRPHHLFPRIECKTVTVYFKCGDGKYYYDKDGMDYYGTITHLNTFEKFMQSYYLYSSHALSNEEVITLFNKYIANCLQAHFKDFQYELEVLCKALMTKGGE